MSMLPSLQFLTLDDIKEHKNIDLKHGEDENETISVSIVHQIIKTVIVNLLYNLN